MAPNNYFQVETMDATQCYGGCEMRGSFVMQGSEGMYLADPQATGKFCQGGTVADGKTAEPFPEQVPPGKCPGTVQGLRVYVDCSTKVTGNTTETTKPDGAKDTTTKNTTCSGNACTTTTTQTSCSASGVCSSTATVSQGFDTQDLNSLAGGMGSGGSGSGSSDPCASNPSASGCGGAPAGQPDLYAKKTKTFGDALGTFKNTLSGSPLGQGVTGFFNVNITAGTCPVWTMNIEYFSSSTPVDFYCSDAMQSLLDVLRAVLLVVAGWAAFRIALY